MNIAPPKSNIAREEPIPIPRVFESSVTMVSVIAIGTHNDKLPL
jgi:hypothetical protein